MIPTMPLASIMPCQRRTRKVRILTLHASILLSRLRTFFSFLQLRAIDIHRIFGFGSGPSGWRLLSAIHCRIITASYYK